MMPYNRFCATYGIAHPIASAGMAFVASSPDLAIAVAKAGGLAAIGAGILPPEGVSACLGAFRGAVTSPVNLNFVTFMTTDDTIALCEDLRPEIVSFHWGHPAPAWIGRLHAAGIKVWEQVGTTVDAQQAIDDGIDLVIVQGTEAGGHNYGTLPLLESLQATRAAIGDTSLLLAAGGIVDGAGLAATIRHGADGAMIGSRLVASVEADAHADYKAAIVASDGGDTVRTSMFGRDMPHFNPMRVIKNAVVRDWHQREAAMPPNDDALPIVATVKIGPQSVPARRFSSFVPTRDTVGDLTQMALLAGQGIGGIRTIEPVADIIGRMAAEAEAILSQTGT
jgi:NAD(P)H-dependent flavin oxidoreductase YrpB (nitropropane dioxygenase family)